MYTAYTFRVKLSTRVSLGRRAAIALLLTPILVLAFLWLEAGRDTRYLARVLWHQDSSTDDHLWKAYTEVTAAAAVTAWPQTLDCPEVTAAYAQAHGVSMQQRLHDTGALSFVVVRAGRIVCEWYGNGGAPDRPAAAFSISKTVLSLLLARAVADGTVPGLGVPVTAGLPQLRERDPRFGAITLAHLLDMRSGIAFDEHTSFPWVNRDAPAVYYATDLACTVERRVRIDSAPGTFAYNDYGPNLIGLTVQRAYGVALTRDVLQRLWTDIGAQYPARWSTDDQGFAHHESGLVATARDLARVGQLMLDDGRTGGRQAAPAAFVDRSLRPAERTTATTFAEITVGYRNGWWALPRPDGGEDLAAMGAHGQIMLVSPASDTVVVQLSTDRHNKTNIEIATGLQRLADRLARN
jgi:CubicO group peptidase (beta-lactamase class C family)